jgi:preprotein translocase subunit SecG
MMIFIALIMIVVALFLILLVLVQRGRGGGLAGALGGMGGQSAFGTKAGDTFTRVTIVAATIWILLALLAVKLAKMNSGPLGDAAAASQAAGLAEELSRIAEGGTAEQPVDSPAGSQPSPGAESPAAMPVPPDGAATAPQADGAATDGAPGESSTDAE